MCIKKLIRALNIHILSKIIFPLLLFSHSLSYAISLPSKSEEATLYQRGEEALRKGDLLAAEEHYKALWERVLKQKMVLGSTQNRLQDNLSKDIAVRYLSLLNRLKEAEKADRIIQQMMELFSPAAIAEIYYEKAKLLCAENKPQEAFLLLYHYNAHLHLKEWPIKMQSFYKALEFSLNEYYNKKLKEAEGHLRLGDSDKGEEALNEVAQAVEKGLFPSMGTQNLR